MSELLDERVVEMRFDNADFERNVGQSIKTINKLKESLDFDDAGQSFDNLAASAAKVDLSPMEESIEKIAVKFNMLELVAANVLSNIVNKAVNAGMQFAKSVFTDQVTAGWSKYQRKTEAVQTIIAATGESIDTINQKLEKLIWFADETSYDFVDMTNNIGKFTSAGVDLDVAVKSMMGISNWAALSGAGIQQASRAMYNLSQSIGMGAVKIADWRSIELANMATKEFKDTAIAMGLEYGTLKKINGEITTLDGKVTVTSATMRESLKSGWFNTDVLNATLGVFSEFTEQVKEFQETHPEFNTVSKAIEEMVRKGKVDVDSIGYRAFVAAQEAKTLTEAINATKDAVSSGWMRTFELIFGNYDQAKKLWTSLANDLIDIFAAPGDARNEKLADIMKSNYQKMLDEMPDPDEFNTALYNKLYKYVKANRGEEIAQDMFSKFESIEELLKNVNFYDSELESVIKDISKDNSLELKRVSDLSHNLKNKQTSLKQIAIQLAKNQFGADEETARKNLEKIGWDYDKVLEFAEAWKNGVEIDWDAEQKDFEEYLDERYGILLEFNQKLSNFDLFSGLREFGGRDKLVASYENIMSFFKNFYLLILGVGDGIGSLFGNGGSPLSTAIDGFYKLTKVLGDAGTFFEQLLELSDDLFGFIIPESWDRFLHGYDVDIEMASLYEQTEHIPGLIDRITTYYEEHLKTLPEEVQNTIKTITGNVTEFFNSIPERVKKLRKDILGVEKEYINLNADGKWETKIVREGGIINEWKTQLESFGNGIIPKALNGISNFLNRISGYLFGYKNDAGEFEGIITWIYNKVQSFINLLKTIGKNAKDIFNTVLEDIKTFFTGGKYSFSNATIWSFPSRLKKHFEDLKNTPAFQEIKRFFLGEIAPDGTIIKNNIFGKISRVVSEFVSSKPFQDVKAFFFGKEANTQTFGQAARIPGLFEKIGNFVKNLVTSVPYQEIKKFILGDIESGEPSIFGKISGAIQSIKESTAYKNIHDFFFGNEESGIPNLFGKIRDLFESIEASAPFQAVRAVIDFLTGKQSFSSALGEIKDVFMGRKGRQRISKGGDALVDKLMGANGGILSAIFGGDIEHEINNVKGFLFGNKEKSKDNIFVRIKDGLDELVWKQGFLDFNQFLFGDPEKEIDNLLVRIKNTIHDFFFGNKEKGKNNIFGRIKDVLDELVWKQGFLDFNQFLFGDPEKEIDNLFVRIKNSLHDFFMGNEAKGIDNFLVRTKNTIHDFFLGNKTKGIDNLFVRLKNGFNKFITDSGYANFHDFIFGNHELKQDSILVRVLDSISKKFEELKTKFPWLQSVCDFIINQITKIKNFIRDIEFKIHDLFNGTEDIPGALEPVKNAVKDIFEKIKELNPFNKNKKQKGFFEIIADAFTGAADGVRRLMRLPQLIHDLMPVFGGIALLLLGIGGINLGGLKIQSPLGNMVDMLTDVVKSVAIIAGLIAGLSVYLRFLDTRGWICLVGAAVIIGAITVALVQIAEEINGDDKKEKSGVIEGFQNAADIYFMISFIKALTSLIAALAISIAGLSFVAAIIGPWNVLAAAAAVGAIIVAVGFAIKLMNDSFDKSKDAKGKLYTHASELFGLAFVLFSIANLLSTIVIAFSWLYFLTKGKTIKDLETPLILIGGILTAIVILIAAMGRIIKSISKDGGISKKSLAALGSLEAFIIILTRIVWLMSLTNNWESIAASFLGISAVLWSIAGLMKILSTIKDVNTNVIWSVVRILVALAAVTGVIALAIGSGITIKDFNEYAKYIAGIALLGVLLVEYARIFKYVNKQLDGIKLDFVGKLIGLTAAIIAFAAVINLISVLGTEMADFGAALKMMEMLALFGVLLVENAWIFKYVNKQLDGIKLNFVGKLIGLTAAIIAFAAVINLISVLGTEMADFGAALKMMGMLVLFGGLLSGFALLTKFVQNLDISKKGILTLGALAGIIGGLALLIWELSAIANRANIHTYDAILPMLAAIGEVAAAMVVTSALILAAGAIGTIINHVVLLGVLSAIVGFGILAGAVWGLAEIANQANIHTYDAILPMLAAIGEVAAAMVVTSGLLVLAGLLGTGMIAVIPGIIAAIIGFGILAGAVFGLSKLSDKIGPKTLEDISAFLIGIARTFGEMFGAFAGGFGEGLTDSLPTIGKNLSTFMENLEGFLDGVSQINDSHLMGSLRFAAIMLTIGADTLLGALSALVQLVVGDENFTQVGTNMTDLMNNMSGFLSGLLDITESHVKGAGYFTQVLAFITGESILNLVSALVQSVVGDENFAKVGTNMTDLITNLSGFLSAVTGVTEAHVTGADYLTQVLEKITGESILGLVSSLIQQVVGDEKFTKVGTNMTDFITNLSGFLSAVTGVTEAHVTGANYLNQVLRFMGSALLKAAIDNLLAVFVGDSNFADLASKMKQLAAGTVAFGNTLKETDLSTVENGVGIVKALLDLVTDKKYKSGGIAGFFSDIINGTVKFDDLFTTLNNDIADNFVTFSNKMAKANPENAKKAAEVLPILFDMLSDDKYRKGGITGFFKDMVLGDAKDSFNKMFLLLLGENGEGGLIDGLSEFSDRLSSFTPEELDLDKVYKTVQTMQSLFDLMSFDPINLIGDSVSRINEWGGTDTISSTEYIINTLAIIREDLVTELKNFQNDIEAAEINPEIIKNTIGSYSELIRSLIDLSKFDGMIGAPEIGNYVIEGLINALRAGETRVEDAARGVANAVQNGLTLTLQIQSPSKVAYKIGQFVAEGLTIGLRDGEPLAESMARQLGEGTIKALKAGAERYDAYGLSQHAINMITEDLVDEHIFDMPDFSFTNRLGMEDIDFEAMRKFMREKFSEVLDPEMIDRFVNSYMKEFNELPKEIKDSDYAKVMTDIAKGEYGLGQDTIIDALEEELGSVSAAEQAWEDYNDVLKGNIKINKDLLKQKKENPPMTYEEYMAMVEHEQKGIELANKGFFDDFAKANGVTREEAMSFFGYDPKITQNALNQMTMNSQEMFDAWEKRITDQALADEEAKLLREWEQYVLGIGNTAADVNQKIETESTTTTETLEQTSKRIDKSVRDVVKKFRNGEKLTEKELKRFLTSMGNPKSLDSFLKGLNLNRSEFDEYINESKKQYGLLSKTEHYDKLDPAKLNNLLQRIQNGATEISKADSELLKSLAIATQTEGKFGVGVEGREKALMDFGIDNRYASLARELASNSNIDKYIKDTYKISDANKEAEESTNSLLNNASKEWKEVYSEIEKVINEAANKGLESFEIDPSMFKSLGEDWVSGLTDIFGEVNENGKLKINFKDLSSGISIGGKPVKNPQDFINALGMDNIITGVLNGITGGNLFSDLGGLPKLDELSFKDISKYIKSAVTDLHFFELLPDWVSNALKSVLGIDEAIDDINEKGLDLHADTSEITQADNYLQSILDKYKLSKDEETTAMQGYKNLINGDFINTAQKAALEKLWQGMTTGSYGAQMQEAIKTVLDTMGISWDVLNSYFGPGGHSMLEQYTTDALRYAEDIKNKHELGTDYTIKDLIHDAHDKGSYGTDIARKKAWESMNVDYEKAMQVYSDYLEYGDDIFDKTKADARGIRYYAENYAFLTDAEIEALKAQERIDTALASTPEGAFAAIGDFLKGVNQVLESDDTAENFTKFVTSITDSMKSLNLDNAPAFKQIGDFLKMVQQTSNASSNITTDFGPMFQSIADSINSVEIKSEQFQPIADFLTGVLNLSESAKDFINPFKELVTSLIEMPEGDASAKAGETARIIVETILQAFRERYDDFTEIGANFVIQLITGMLSQRDFAIKAANSVSTSLLTAFQQQAVDKASKYGQDFTTALSQGIASEESVTGLKNALNTLFGIPTEGAEGMTDQSAGAMASLGETFGKTFGTDFVTGFGSSVAEQQDLLSTQLQPVVDGLTGITSAFTTIEDPGAAITNFVSSIGRASEEVIDSESMTSIELLAGRIESIISSAVPDGYGMGWNFVEGLYLGLLDGWSAYGDMISGLSSGMGSGAVDSLRESIESNSPSRATRRLGGYFVEGFMIGLQNGVDSVYSSSVELADASLDGIIDTVGIHSPGVEPQRLGEVGVAGGYGLGIENGKSYVYQASEDLANASMAPMSIMTQSAPKMGEEFVTNFGDAVSFAGYRNNPFTVISELAQESSTEAVHEVKEASDLLNAVQFKAPGFNDIAEIPHKFMTPLQQAAAKTITTVDDLDESVKQAANDILDLNETPQSTSMMLPVPENAYIAAGNALRQFGHVSGEQAKLLQEVWNDVMRGEYGVVGDLNKNRDKMLLDKINMTWAEFSKYDPMHNGNFDLTDAINGTVLPAEELEVRLHGVKDLVYAIWDGSLGIGDTIRKDIVEGLGYSYDIVKKLVYDLKYNPGSINWDEAEKDASTQGNSIGNNVVSGVAKGLKSRIVDLKNQTVQMVSTMTGKATEILGIQSPSKVFMEYGQYVVEGLAIGIGNNTYLAENSITDLSNVLTNTFNESTISLADLIETDFNTDPVITPVIDMSNVYDSASDIDAMLSREQAIAISTSENAKRIQNGEEMSAVGATYNFTQNNYSPKALSRAELYRQTKNQFALLKGV